MNHTALYTAIEETGFSVLVFEDHPKFFGNWRAQIKRERTIYEVVSDNRDGWLTLWHITDNGKREKLFEVESSRFGQEQQLTTVKQWLRAGKNL